MLTMVMVADAIDDGNDKRTMANNHDDDIDNDDGDSNNHYDFNVDADND